MQNLAAGYMAVLNAFRVMSGVVIFSIFLLIVADVIMRLTGIPPWTYISAIVEYGLLWFTMLAAPYLVRIKGHVFIDAVTQLLPPAIQRVLAKAVYLICVSTSVIFFFYSLRLLIEAIVSDQIDTRGEDMQLWLLLLPIPISFFLVALEFGRFLIGWDSMYGERTDMKDNV